MQEYKYSSGFGGGVYIFLLSAILVSFSCFIFGFFTVLFAVNFHFFRVHLQDIYRSVQVHFSTLSKNVIIMMILLILYISYNCRKALKIKWHIFLTHMGKKKVCNDACVQNLNQMCFLNYKCHPLSMSNFA